MKTEILEKLCNKENLIEEEVNYFFSELMSGNLDPLYASAILIALKIKKPSPDEIFFASECLLKSIDAINHDKKIIDLCGTGGDSKSTINVSTISSLILAGLKVNVAKHGNRSVSSKVGSADLFESIGFNFDDDLVNAISNIEKKNISFLFAPNFHKSMKNVANIRKSISTRTIFNILGPLINPLRPKYQLLGVYEMDLLDPIINVLKLQGLKAAMVVHSFDGMDEISICDKTQVVELKNNKVTKYIFDPREYGFKLGKLENLVINNVEDSKNTFFGIIDGSIRDERRDICILNSGVGYYLYNNKLRKGIINVTFSGNYRDSLSVITTTFDNFYINNKLIQGEMIVTNNGKNSNQNLWFNIDVNNASINTQNGVINWQSNRIREWISGAETYLDLSDDIYRDTGSSNGNAANGNTFSMQIIDPLHIDLSCFPTCVITNGSAEINPDGYPSRIVQYGDSTCDCNVDVIIDNEKYPLVVEY